VNGPTFVTSVTYKYRTSPLFFSQYFFVVCPDGSAIYVRSSRVRVNPPWLARDAWLPGPAAAWCPRPARLDFPKLLVPGLSLA